MSKHQPWLHKPEVKVVFFPPAWILAILIVLLILGWMACLELAIQNYELRSQIKMLVNN